MKNAADEAAASQALFRGKRVGEFRDPTLQMRVRAVKAEDACSPRSIPVIKNLLPVAPEWLSLADEPDAGRARPPRRGGVVVFPPPPAAAPNDLGRGRAL